jgi:hypothetical protein
MPMKWELSNDSESSTVNSQLVRYCTDMHNGPAGEFDGLKIWFSVTLSDEG